MFTERCILRDRKKNCSKSLCHIMYCVLVAFKKYQYLCVVFLVPPNADYVPNFTRVNPRTSQQKDLTGPYLENNIEDFTCYIRNVLPGKDSSSLTFYYNGKLRLQSKNVGTVLESNESDGTKSVAWWFNTSFTQVTMEEK